MRPRLPCLARNLILSALPALLGACSASVSQEPIATGSLPPRPPEGMVRESAPSPWQTSSLGYANDDRSRPTASPNRWSEAQRPTGSIQQQRPAENPDPMRWQTWTPPRDRGPAYPAPASQTVEVREGDTLYGLSRRYGVSVADLIAANRLTNARLEMGQKLVLPAPAHSYLR